jgi:oxygen-dependent protoporphyrinogen oxidase
VKEYLMQNYDMVIIGAGISGLSFAHYCAKSGLKTVILEKSGRVGGCFHSHKFSLDPEPAGQPEDFWLELGAHTCYNSYASLINVIEEAGIINELIPREKAPFKMLSGGKLKSIPSMLDILELILSMPRMLYAKKTGETMESYYSKVFGKKNYSRVLGPVFDAIISQSANDFPADALFKKRPRRKDILKSFTLSHGISTITDAIAGEPGITVLTGREVISVAEFSGGYLVTAAGGEVIRSKYLTLAVPPPAAAGALQAGFPELSAHLARIKAKSVETVGLLLRKEACNIEPVAGIIPARPYGASGASRESVSSATSGALGTLGEVFFSGVSRDVVKDARYRGFAFHFRPGLLDLGQKLDRIARILDISPEQVLKTVEKRDNIIPSLAPGHDEWVLETDRLLAGRSLFITGNYFNGVAIEDCVTRSALEFARLRRSA